MHVRRWRGGDVEEVESGGTGSCFLTKKWMRRISCHACQWWPCFDVVSQWAIFCTSGFGGEDGGVALSVTGLV